MNTRRQSDSGMANLLVLLAAVTTLTCYKVWSRHCSKGVRRNRSMAISMTKLKYTYPCHLALHSEKSTFIWLLDRLLTNSGKERKLALTNEIGTLLYTNLHFKSIFQDSQKSFHIITCVSIYTLHNFHKKFRRLYIHPS